MPIYEYRCQNCKAKFSVLTRTFSEPPEVKCARCGAAEVKRLFSTFIRGRKDTDIYEDILSDQHLMRGMLANDPKSLAKWSRKMGDTAGGNAPEYESMMQRMEAGESWENIAGEMQQSELDKSGESSAATEEG